MGDIGAVLWMFTIAILVVGLGAWLRSIIYGKKYGKGFFFFWGAIFFVVMLLALISATSS
jgi:hypothetical protein